MAAFSSNIDITSGGTYGMDVTNGESSLKVANDLNGKMANIQQYLQNGLPEVWTGDSLPDSLPNGKILFYNDNLYYYTNSMLTVSSTIINFGTYTGNGKADHRISVGFQPKAVLVIDPVTDTSTTDRLNFCGLGLQGNPVSSHVQITANGFFISRFTPANQCLNVYNRDYIFIAFH